MGEQATLAGWRLRAASRAGAVLACAALAALMVAVSSSVILLERPIGAIEVVIEQAPPAPPPDQPNRRVSPSAPTAAYNGAAPATPSIDAAMGAQLLRCVVRPGQPRPADCPREAEPEDWRRPSLPVGGNQAPREPSAEMNALYSRLEQTPAPMPSCIRDKTHNVCIRIGQRPPPPSRSAEQLCEEEGLGGPCALPPDRP